MTNEKNISSSLECIKILYPPLSSESETKLSINSNYNNNTGTPDESKFNNTIIWNCTWSHDGRYLAMSFGINICIFLWEGNEMDNKDNTDFTHVATLKGGHERTVRYLEFAPPPSIVSTDHYVLATASFDGTVAIWESSSSTPSSSSSLVWDLTAQLEGHESEVKCVTWNSTGTLLASCGRDKSIWIWECFLSGSIGGSGEEGDLECLAVLSSGHEGDIKHIEFCSSHGQFGDGDDILLSSSYDNTIRCWAEDDGDWYCAAVLDSSVHSNTIWSFSITSGIRMVSGSADGSLAIWRFYTSRERKKLESEQNNPSNGDGLWKCVGRLPNAHGEQSLLQEHNESNTNLKFPISNVVQPIYCVHCAPARLGHGRIASASGDNSIQIYREVLGGTADRPLFVVDVSVPNAHHNSDVNCIRWHPRNGKILATAGDDGVIKIWKYSAV